jgi:eukaryotic-like serine/threonine-protein kinase
VDSQRLSHYELLHRIGEGGMGEVWLARDTHLGRHLAIKMLCEDAADDAARRRLRFEARTVSALNHPHIVTVYDVGRDAGGRDFIAMELLDGEALSNRLARHEHGIDLALEVGLAVASALVAAHAAGIVHRDVKPANVMLTRSGQVKLLDFGIAKLTHVSGSSAQAPTMALPATAAGTVVGTPAYMAPEQIEGREVDSRTDVFALGLLLFELACGRRAFQAQNPAALLGAILRDPAPPLARSCRGCPPALSRLVADCLAKSPGARPTSAEVLQRLSECALHWQRRHTLAARMQRPALAWPTAAALLLATVAAGWHWHAGRKGAQALVEGLREVEALVADERQVDAFARVLALRETAPGDPRLAQWLEELSFPADLITEPAGARLRVKSYAEPDSPWIELGNSNQRGARVPAAHVRWRVEREGFLPLQLALSVPPATMQLTPLDVAPHGMLQVPKGTSMLSLRLPPREFDTFWLGRTEVTNAEFQRFVDAGGYRSSEWWTEPFVEKGTALDFAEAVARFRDATGRPGPAGWELGRYPDGKDDLPVTGISWFEAAAYAVWAGGSLPSAWHWVGAAAHSNHSDVLVFGNFESAGALAVASRHATSPYGHEDLAGNVAEWTSTRQDGAMLTLGGHWRSSSYLFNDVDATDPWMRADHLGMRVARIDGTVDSALHEAPPRVAADFGTPVSDEVFAALLRFYASDPAAEPGVLEGEEAHPYWRLQRWRIPSAYGNDSFRLWLYLPNASASPHHAVLYAPTSSAHLISDSARDGARDFAWLVRSGRAVAFPVYANTYERRLPDDAPPATRRATRMRWSQDAARVIDLLQTHPDIDQDTLAFVGYSLGANAGVSMLAVEPRIRVGVLMATGLHPRETPPELDLINFLPRIRQPLLLLGGRNDFINPLDTSQRPLFERIGTDPALKKHHVFEGGHVPARMQELIGVVLDWLDTHQGPVQPPR